jgi:hypothetical protein
MKSTILSICFVVLIAWLCQAQSRSVTDKHEPNGGYVSDAGVAKDIAKAVMRPLLKAEVFNYMTISDAALTNGVWTVHYWGLKTDFYQQITIMIRQTTGAIIKYENPNA